MKPSTSMDGIGTTPYWWEAAPPSPQRAQEQPARIDVAVIGAGYTGLSAALTLARAGRGVVVFDAQAPGFGGSSRNGGMMGPSFQKVGTAALMARYGERKTVALLEESLQAMEFTIELIAREGIACAFARVGRFRGAHTQAHYDAIAREAERLGRYIDLRAEIVPRSEQRKELGTDLYHGGIVYHRDAGLHPAQYHAGLLACAVAAGVQVLGFTPVEAVQPDGDAWTLRTRLGPIDARQVLVATNAYSGRLLPQFRRRVLPIRSAMVATEPLPAAVVARLMPKRRLVGDTRRLLSYYRPSPDGMRILFGGRAPSLSDAPAMIVANHRRALLEVFPELEQVKITHAWSGLIAYTFDHTPHLGRLDGLYYAMGYCGSGVGRTAYFGHKIALKMLGSPQGATEFDELAFESRPLYIGNPWFMPAVLQWYRLADRLGL